VFFLNSTSLNAYREQRDYRHARFQLRDQGDADTKTSSQLKANQYACGCKNPATTVDVNPAIVAGVV